MKNNGLLLILIAVGAYFLTQKKSAGTSTTTKTYTGTCLSWSQALGYYTARLIASGKLPTAAPSLEDLVPDRGSGGYCITREFIDDLVREMA